MTISTGPFEVEVLPDPPISEKDGVTIGRFRCEKRFSGALVGTSEVFMTGVGTPDPKLRAYVAVERIEGTLDGKQGSFVVTQTGSMNHEGMSLAIPIVAGSGTGELKGITGKMSIRIEAGGAHFYEIDYTIG